MTHYRMDDPNKQPPRDGTLIDLWRSDGTRSINWSWNEQEHCWMQRHGIGGCTILPFLDGFTHWAPIVPPPAEPQESLIRWHGAEVAATWPVGSIVLVDQTRDDMPFFGVITIVVQRHIHNYPSHWRYALIRRGGVDFPLDIKRGGPFDHISESMKRR